MAYNLENSYHAVKVYKLHTNKSNSSGVMLSFGCTSCRFEQDCMHIKHKQDKCFVAINFAKILKGCCKGHVNSFYSDTFYINTNPRGTRIFFNLMKKALEEQYSK